MNRIKQLIFALALFLLTSNAFAQCSVIPMAKPYPFISPNPFYDCDVRLYLDYMCICTQQCSQYTSNYLAVTVIDHNNFPINYYTESSPSQCCVFVLVGAHITKTDYYGGTEILFWPSGSLLTLQGILDSSINYTSVGFLGAFIKDCNGNSLASPVGFSMSGTPLGLFIQFP